MARATISLQRIERTLAPDGVSVGLVFEDAGLIALRGSRIRRIPADAGAVDQLRGQPRILAEEFARAEPEAEESARRPSPLSAAWRCRRSFPSTAPTARRRRCQFRSCTCIRC